MDLTLVLQRVYDSEINVTITWIWDDGFDFSFLTYMDWMEGNRPIDHMKVIASVNSGVGPIGPDPWHEVKTAGELAEAIHEAAIEKYPESEYAKMWGRVN